MPPKDRRQPSPPTENTLGSPGSTDPDLARRILAEVLEARKKAQTESKPQTPADRIPRTPGKSRRRTKTPPPDQSELTARDEEYRKWRGFKELEPPSTEKKKKKPKNK